MERSTVMTPSLATLYGQMVSTIIVAVVIGGISGALVLMLRAKMLNLLAFKCSLVTLGSMVGGSFALGVCGGIFLISGQTVWGIVLLGACLSLIYICVEVYTYLTNAYK